MSEKECWQQRYWQQCLWNTRYLYNGKSGQGSVGLYRKWKWSIVTEHIGSPSNIIDVGCGDLSFWENRTCNRYVGIDFSEVIIDKIRKLRPKWKFVCGNAADFVEGLDAEVVFCFDLLFHVMNDEDYLKILENLCRYSRKWIFLNTWVREPHIKNHTYMIYRNFQESLKVFLEHGFELVHIEECFDGINALHVFKKKET